MLLEATPDGETGAPALCPLSGDVVAEGAVATGRIEFVLAGGGRLIVNRAVDGAALARVLAVLEGR